MSRTHFRVNLHSKWLWVRVPLQSLKTSDIAPVSSKELLDIQANIECGFTLKRVRDMIRTYSQTVSHLTLSSKTNIKIKQKNKQTKKVILRFSSTTRYELYGVLGNSSLPPLTIFCPPRAFMHLNIAILVLSAYIISPYTPLMVKFKPVCTLFKKKIVTKDCHSIDAN